MRYHASITDALESSPSTPVLSIATDIELNASDLEEHGLHSGVSIPCRKSSKGIIACMACIDIDQRDILATLEHEEKTLCLDIIERLDRAGRQGISYESFVVSSLSSWHNNIPELFCTKQTNPLRSRSIHTLIRRLTSSRYPLCYWVGYAHPVLVSRRHIRDWTVLLPASPPQLMFPRRWLNIKGELMEDVWVAGLRAVVGVLVIRPGIPQVAFLHDWITSYSHGLRTYRLNYDEDLYQFTIARS
jgi:oxalate---CoA ligase